MLNSKDTILAQEFRETLEDCDVKVTDSDLPKLVSMFYKELKIIGKGRNNETEGEAFEHVLIWANDSYDLNHNESIDWGERETSITEKTLKLDYGKSYSNKTAVIRFLVPDIERRDSLYKFWNRFSNFDKNLPLSTATEEFSKITIKSKKIQVEWCRYKYHHDKSWSVGPENIIYCVKSVVKNEEFVYVCFDLDGLDILDLCDTDFFRFEKYFANLQDILIRISGVKKIWLKIRPETNTKIEYTYFYPMADGTDAGLIETPLKSEYEWLS